MNKKTLCWKGLGIALAGFLAISGSAADRFCWQENFRNYNDKAPGVNNVAGTRVGNDPIWVNGAEFNVWAQPAEKAQEYVMYKDGIAVPNLKDVTIAFTYRYLNNTNPEPEVPAKKDRKGNITKPAVPAKPGVAKCFKVFVNKTVVVIGSDYVEINGKKASMPFAWNRIWCEGAIQVKNGKLTVFCGPDRKLAKVLEIPFKDAVSSVNFGCRTDNGFSITNIQIEEKGALRDNSASKHFADFRSLSQPVQGTKDGAVLTPDATGYMGVRFQMNGKDKPVEMVLTWDNGVVETRKIEVTGSGDQSPVGWNGRKRGQGFGLPDAKISVGGIGSQSVRPAMRRFRSTYSAEPQWFDIIRDWELLPPASKHPLDLEFVVLPDGSAQVYFDGSYIRTLKVNANKADEDAIRKEIAAINKAIAVARRDKKPDVQAAEQAKLKDAQRRLAALPSAKLVKVELKGNGMAVFAMKKSLRNVDPKYHVIDLSANPRAKTFADATSSLKEGMQVIDGIPFNVAKPMDSADVMICKQGMGNWALEVEEYLGRQPEDGYPSAIHYRLPADAYGTAHVILAIDPDASKDLYLTTRMGYYVNNGSGGNMLGDTDIEIKDGKIPENFKQIGTVELNGKKVPLYKVEIKLATGNILDIAARNDYLEFEFLGRGWENFQQMDNSMKPSPYHNSAFNIFAVTLEKAPAVMDFRQASPGNVFKEDEKAYTTVLLRAKQANSDGVLEWEARDVDGKVVFTGSKKFKLKNIGDKTEIEIPLKAGVGYYDLDVKMSVNGRLVFFHPARFAILGKDTRKATATGSPYATWWFNSHGSPGDAHIGGPIMNKAGIRKCSWVFPTAEMCATYNITNTGNIGCPLGYRDIDVETGRFKNRTVDRVGPDGKKYKEEISGEQYFIEKVKENLNSKKAPWCVDHMLVWHESGPGYGIPEELLNMPITDDIRKNIENDKRLALFINEVGRIMKANFPQIRIQIGNSSASIGAATRPLRAGADIKYYDSIGIETPSQVIPPERLIECGLQGMLVAQEIATKLGGLKDRKVPLNGSWEYVYRADRDMGEQLQAEWHARDVLISLANNFTLISPGILFDCKNGYYNGLWGGSGILQRGPYVYPKRAYVAYAALTKVLDCAKFIRQIPTGSTTVYALEFKVYGGKTVTALWAARGAVDFAVVNPSGKALVTDLYGRESTVKGKEVTIKGGSAVTYLTTDKPLTSVKIAGRSFPVEEARAAKSKVASALDNADLVTVAPDEQFTSNHNAFLPILKPADYTVATVNDPEKGNCIAVTLTADDKYKSKYITEFTTITLKEPALVPGNPKAVGVWVKGNSNWGQIRFVIEDAQGEIFKNLTTGRSWGCDIMDWPGNLGVDFDGWSFVGTALFPSKVFPTHSPGPVSDQWVSCGGDKKIDLPIKIRAITVGMNRYKLDLLDFKETDRTILIRDVGGIEE